MKKLVSLAIHLGLWVIMIFLLIPASSWLSYETKIVNVNSLFLKHIIFSIFLLIPAMISFYSLFFFTTEIIKKKWKVIFPIGVYLITILYLNSTIATGYKSLNIDGMFIFNFINFSDSGLRINIAGLFVLEFLIFSILIFGILGSLFRFQLEWRKNQQEKFELGYENNESKMALLRSQINPHFLFNTLHNIDALIKNNNKKASASIEKLSDIMRYMLKDAKYDFVDLQKEIVHLESYISLEKLRLKNQQFLDYSLNGDITAIKIAPMILMPFVENAFKHAVDSSVANGIRIKINIENHRLEFYCENQFDKTEINKDKGHGIGLKTVQKRLDLIYKNKHKLIISSEHSVFKVNLELELDEN